MALRDYQSEANAAIHEDFKTLTSTLVVVPTGGGKTVIAASVIKDFFPGRCIFMAHRDTLIYQAKETIESFTGLRCDVEMAGSTADHGLFERAPVVITTVQTQLAGCGGAGRMTKFDPNDFACLIVDEAHHYTSPGWRKAIDYYRKNPNLKILGITATPDRADEAALGQIFEGVAFDYEILDAIHDGWLCRPDQQFVKVGLLDYSDVHITAGDLNGGELARILEQEKIAQGMVGAAIPIAGDRQFVFFTVSVAQAEMVANIFNRYKAGMCEWVYDGTPKEERRVLLDKFRRKEIQGIANVGILTEGWDDRGVSVCFMGRPTASRALYAQQAGRVLRPLKGVVDDLPTREERKAAIEASAKPYALVIDFVGNSGKHKLMTLADILGGKVSDEALARAVKKAKETEGPVRMDELLDKSEAEINAEKEKRRMEEEARKVKLVARVKYQAQQVNPFDVMDIRPVKARGWDEGKQLSIPQRNVLLKQGINPDSMPYHEAKQVLNELFRRWNTKECTFGQAKILKKYGYNDRTHVSASEAKAIIDIIAYEQGWKPRLKKKPQPA